MNVLLDFVNVKEWNCDALSGLPKLCRTYSTQPGKEPGKETAIASGILQLNFILEPMTEDSKGMWMNDFDNVLPGDHRFNDLFAHLADIQKKWVDIILQTAANGPDIGFLNIIADQGVFAITPGTNPWAAGIKYKATSEFTIEGSLEADYLRTFIAGRGENFKKLRQCRKLDCGKWFVYNRPKQIFCSDKCRLDHHNAIYTADGRAAAHQRKGRAERPEIYLK